ncbi:MAG: hypothetical protein JO069_13175 [Verrucomicrobia bacterium]|nr:hypothetical protein [Verrucomicrobiota bacterium]
MRRSKLRQKCILLALALAVALAPTVCAQATGGTPEALKQALEADGFVVQNGKFKVIPLFDMYDAHIVPSCFGNNISTPYVLPMVPLAPGQTADNLPIPNPITDYPLVPEDQGLYYEYFLRPDEAIVLVGKTPPSLAYFGYRSYLARRNVAGAYKYIFASLGDQANNLTTATAGTPFGKFGTDPYAQAAMFISTADAGTDRRVRAAAQAAGYAPEIINTDVIPSSLVKLGLTGTPDSFAILHRAAVFADAQAGQAYFQNPGMTVFRITPKQQGTPESFPVPSLRVKGTGVSSELDLLPTLEALGQAIRAKYDYLTPRDLQPGVVFGAAGYDAIQRGTDALGDNRDTIYLESSNFFLRNRPDDFTIVYGANHMATGKATYSNFTVYGRIPLNGVAGVDSKNFGTAEEFLPGNPLAKYFYVYKIARHCVGGDTVPCVEIPTGPGAAGIPIAQPVVLGFRAYLEPSTKVGPIFEEVLYDRAIKFNPQ